MKRTIDGVLIALQFYTILPVKRELPLDKIRLKRAGYTIPFIGIGIGLLLVTLLILNEFLLQLPLSVLALLIVTIPIVMTGGLHLDGWMDASDAFFSYRDHEKRLQIMDDPRTGSFAVLSVIFLLTWRFVFLFETLKLTSTHSLILIVSLYYFARMAMCYLFIYGNLAKKDGMAAFFKKGLERKDFIFHFLCILALFLIIAYFNFIVVPYIIILLLVTVCLAVISKVFIERQFGGISGDTLGATLEGSETILWFTLWLLHLFGTGLH